MVTKYKFMIKSIADVHSSTGLFVTVIDTLRTSKLTLCIGDSFCWLHDVTGLPWYSTILLTTVILRFFLIGQAHITSRKVSSE